MTSVDDDLGGLLNAADDKLSKIDRPTDASQHHWIHHLAEQRERFGVKSVKAQPFKRATHPQFAMQGIKAGTAEGEIGACAARRERILPPSFPPSCSPGTHTSNDKVPFLSRNINASTSIQARSLDGMDQGCS